MEKIRAFIAVDIEGEPASRLGRLAEALRDTGAQVKVVEEENFHITLRFLGNIPIDMIDEIEKIMRRAVEGIEPHKIRLKGVGAFPSESRPRVIWVGVEGDELLTTIAQRLERDLRRLGFKPETKGFTAHVTLARVKGPRGRERLIEWIEKMRDVDLGEVEVRAIRLKKSTLTPRGPIYETLREVEL